MNKKLPGVFANKVSNVNNNKSVFYSADDRAVEESNAGKKLKGRTVEQKINEIFSSTNYIYKAKVEITLDTGVVTKNIIGKNRKNLITMDNELIPIDKIRDIRYK